MATPPRRYLLMINQKEGDWTQFWFHQIGWVGYFFAQLEWCTFWLADAIGSEEQKDEMCKKRFAERCKYAKRAIVPRLGDQSLRSDWVAFLDEVERTGAMRNKILHNPLNVTVKEMTSHGVAIDKGIQLLKERGGKPIELGDVQQFSDTLKDLNHRMMALMERTGSESSMG